MRTTRFAIGGLALALALQTLAAGAETSFENQARGALDALRSRLRAVGERIEKSSGEAAALPALLYDFDDGEGPVPAHSHPRGEGLVADSAQVSLTAHVGRHASVSGRARVGGWAVVEGRARVRGHARVWGPDVFIDGSAVVEGDAEVSSSARVGGQARVRGQARVLARDPAWPAGRQGTPLVDGEAELSGSAVVCGNAHVTGSAVVAGTARVGGHARVTGRVERGAILEGD